MPARKSTAPKPEKNKSLEQGARGAHLRCAQRGSAFHNSEGIPQVVSDTRHELVRVFLPLEPADTHQPVWSVIFSNRLVGTNA